MSLDNLFTKWIEEEKIKLSRHKVNSKEEAGAKRNYLHFDLRRPESSLFKLREEFTNTKIIATHGYWPFLKNIIKVPKIKNNIDAKTNKLIGRRKEIKERDVYYASHYDALIYSWYSFLLNNYYEKRLKELGLNESVIAYRKIPLKENSNKNKSSINFAFEVFKFIKEKGECVVIVSDITKFFDSLDHEILKTEWKNLLSISREEKLPLDHYIVYKNLTDFKYIDANEAFQRMGIKLKKVVDKKDKKNIKVYKVPFKNGRVSKVICKDRKEFVESIVKGGLIKGNSNINNVTNSKRKGKKCGIMQGAPISATLANIYMASFDKTINDFVDSIGGMYRRYSDDLVVVCSIENYKECLSLVQAKILDYELKMSPKKTCITLFLKNKVGKIKGFEEKYLDNLDKNNEDKFYRKMQYLGFEYDGQNVFLRSSSLAKYYRKMKSKIKKSIAMAYGKKSRTKTKNFRVFKKNLVKKYLYKGRRSFISYAYRAISVGSELLSGDAIKKQLSRRSKIMAREFITREEKIRKYKKLT